MDQNFFLNSLKQNSMQLQKVVSCNQYSEKFGVRLTEEEAKVLLLARKDSLKEQERIEFGDGILPKIIFAFCDSPFIYQDNYVATLEALQNIFYLYKNESLDELTDDELLEYMKYHFDGECQGSLDYLEDTSLERFARKVRSRSHSSMGRYLLAQEDEEDNYEDE